VSQGLYIYCSRNNLPCKQSVCNSATKPSNIECAEINLSQFTISSQLHGDILYNYKECVVKLWTIFMGCTAQEKHTQGLQTEFVRHKLAWKQVLLALENLQSNSKYSIRCVVFTLQCLAEVDKNKNMCILTTSQGWEKLVTASVLYGFP